MWEPGRQPVWASQKPTVAETTPMRVRRIISAFGIRSAGHAGRQCQPATRRQTRRRPAAAVRMLVQHQAAVTRAAHRMRAVLQAVLACMPLAQAAVVMPPRRVQAVMRAAHQAVVMQAVPQTPVIKHPAAFMRLRPAAVVMRVARQAVVMRLRHPAAVTQAQPVAAATPVAPA